MRAYNYFFSDDQNLTVVMMAKGSSSTMMENLQHATEPIYSFAVTKAAEVLMEVGQHLGGANNSISGNSGANLTEINSEMPREYDTGETAWVLACTAITWLMIPGVGFFYNGAAPKKSSLVLFTTCLWSVAVVSIQVSQVDLS